MITIRLLPHLDVYISGSGIAPTVFTEERTLGQYVGTVKNNSTFQRYIGNSFEYKNLTDTSAKLMLCNTARCSGLLVT